jgi:hypothetical protein
MDARVFRLAAVAAFAAVGLAAATQPPERKTARQVKGRDMRGGPYEQCARACNDCQRACDLCADHCGEMLAKGHGDEKDHKSHSHHLTTLRTCRDCATHCAAAAQVVARHGPFSDLICTACAEACKRCGDACEQGGDDPTMKRCAEECKRCEQACRDMLKHTGHGADRK